MHVKRISYVRWQDVLTSALLKIRSLEGSPPGGPTKCSVLRHELLR